MAVSPLVTPPRGRAIRTETPLLVALAVVFLGFSVYGGLSGVVVAFVLAVALVLGGPLLAYLAGTIALLGVGDAVSLGILSSHLLLATVLVGAVTVERGRRVGLLSVLAVTGYIGLFVGTSVVVDGLAATTVTIAALVSCLGYGLHRYELLTLGLIDE